MDYRSQMFYILPVVKHAHQPTQHIYLGCITASSQCTDLSWMDFCSLCEEGSEWLFTCTCKARSGSLSFYGTLSPSSLTRSFLVAVESDLGVCVWSLLDDSGVKGRSTCAVGTVNSVVSVLDQVMPWKQWRHRVLYPDGACQLFQCQIK